MILIDDMIDDAINETMTLTSGNESIVTMITPFDKGLEFVRWGTMPEDAIPEGGGGAFPRGGTDDDSAVVTSDLKYNRILIHFPRVGIGGHMDNSQKY